MRRALRRLAWTLAAAGGLALLARQLVARDYRVHSPSMEPTIHGAEDAAETVLVVFGGGEDLARFDLVAVRDAAGGKPLVKRVAALGGETVLVRHGDLWIDGALLPPDAPRPAPVLVFDDALLPAEEWFRTGSSRGDPWTRAGGVWSLDAREVAAGSDAGMAFLARELRDGYLDAAGRSVPGAEIVHDAILGLELRFGDPPAAVALRLHEMGDTFEVALEPRAGGNALVRLTRRAGTGRSELLGVAPVPWPAGAWRALRFSNVDDHLRLEVDGRELLAASYPGNVPRPQDVTRGVALDRSLGHRVSFGGALGRAEFRRVRVWRDLHYTSRGEHAVREPLQLGPHELFLLGDNSAHSYDGRDTGPTPVEAVFGRPVAVIWPPAHLRRLHGALAPAGAERPEDR